VDIWIGGIALFGEGARIWESSLRRRDKMARKEAKFDENLKGHEIWISHERSDYES